MKTNSNILAVVLTYIAWVLIILMCGWVFVSLSWWLLGSLWFKELFIPHAVKVTLGVFAAVFCWGLAVCLILFAFKRCRNKLEALDLQKSQSYNGSINYWPWSELIIPSREDGEWYKSSSPHSQEHPVEFRCEDTALSPDKMLSRAVVLERGGRTKEAAGLLRIIISSLKASPLIKNIAEYRLIRLIEGLRIEKRYKSSK